MERKKLASVMMIFLLCWVSASLRAAESGRLPFYEARKDGVQIFILGTLHVGKEGELLRQDIAQTLSRSSQLIMEVSSEEMPTVALSMASRFCQDACLRRQVSPATFNKLSLLGRDTLGGEAVMEHIPAWMMSSMLAVIDASKAGLSPQLGTEQQLIQLWGARPTRGLEKPEEQIDALASFEDSVQREMLECYLALPEERRLALTRTLYQIWQSGDAEALFNWYQKMNEEEKLSSNTARKIDEKLVVSRNKRFVERLRPYLTSGKPVFVAVGALHLGGNQGVLALLREQGFSITAR
ncbi:MAG: TraB/GumN family protein [Burkholderiales bacterium]|nr:TraB/GumN family protein [Burkholderiales bacterium]